MELYQFNDIRQMNTNPSEQSTISSVPQCQNLCDKIKIQLQQLIDTSEKTFLDMGNRFLQYSRQGKDISESSNQATRLFFSERVVSAIDELYELLERIRRYLRYNENELNNNSTILQQILTTIKTIYQPFDQFEKLVRKLQFLGISTRIESSRLTNEDKSFETLSADVKALSLQIETKLTRIIEGATSLRQTISKTLGESLRLKSQQYKQAEQILNNTHGCLRVLIETNERSSALAKTLSEQARSLELHIMEIVQSIQFQDIIRQKIEHVIESMDDVIQIANSAYHMQSEQDDAVLEIHDISQLQIDQINQAGFEIHSAITNIIDGLTGIAESMIMIMEGTKSVILVSETQSGSNMDTMESGIDRVTHLLRLNAAANYDLNRAMKESSQMVDDMAGFVDDINQIGYQIGLIALNGIVNAAHIGSEGASLSVLADAIQRLAVDAQLHIKTVSSILTDIIAFADKLNVGQLTTDDKDDLEHIVNEMVSDLATLLDSIRSVHADVDGHMNIVSKNGASLIQDIRQFTKSVFIHHQFQKGFQDVVQHLQTISDLTAGVVAGLDEVTRANRLEKLKERYTMHSERAVHGARFENSDELVNVGNENDSDLGDNIELF
ncbi:hypothetical protein JW960_15890 [candidate division KSB1 bacterium]|nr:hypothetical protein [candidate division KSB1 bacterium]